MTVTGSVPVIGQRGQLRSGHWRRRLSRASDGDSQGRVKPPPLPGQQPAVDHLPKQSMPEDVGLAIGFDGEHVVGDGFAEQLAEELVWPVGDVC